jgi:hypothetical protein
VRTARDERDRSPSSDIPTQMTSGMRPAHTDPAERVEADALPSHSSDVKSVALLQSLDAQVPYGSNASSLDAHPADDDDRTIEGSVMLQDFPAAPDSDKTVAFPEDWLDELASTACRSQPPPPGLAETPQPGSATAAMRALQAPEPPPAPEMAGRTTAPSMIGPAEPPASGSARPLAWSTPLDALPTASSKTEEQRRVALLLIAAGVIYFFAAAGLIWSLASSVAMAFP